MAESNRVRPVHVVHRGRVRVAVWRHEEPDAPEAYKQHTMSLTRVDKNGGRAKEEAILERDEGEPVRLALDGAVAWIDAQHEE